MVNNCITKMKKAPPQPEGNSRGFHGPAARGGNPTDPIQAYTPISTSPQKKAPTEAGAGDALRRSVYIGYSKILPHSLTRRVPKLRIGGLHKKKAPTEAGAKGTVSKQRLVKLF